MVNEKRELLDAETITRILRRIANEIIERERGTDNVVLVGIRTGGVYLAERIARIIEEIEGKSVLHGTVDITLYRDDLFRGLPRPEVGPTVLPFRLEDKRVILVDDVLFTGRTVRAALDVLNDYGRPKHVRLVVLIDRGRRELPIQADYIGMRVEAFASQTVKVYLSEYSETDRAVLLEKENM